MAEAVLDIIAEDPEIPHVADQVHPAAMKEHGSYKGQSNGRQCQVRSGPGEHLGGDHAELADEAVERRPEGQFIEERDDIDQNYENRDDRKRTRANVVAERYHDRAKSAAVDSSRWRAPCPVC